MCLERNIQKIIPSDRGSYVLQRFYPCQSQASIFPHHNQTTGYFASVPELPPSNLLTETLNYNLAIAFASNSEKARSELIIAPILVDLRRQLKEQISLFSRVDFSIDDSKGLNGICDFIITKSPEILIISAPVITVVEAKKENINAGLGQCVAEMVAAQIFNQTTNQQSGNIKAIYGAVTQEVFGSFSNSKNKPSVSI